MYIIYNIAMCCSCAARRPRGSFGLLCTHARTPREFNAGAAVNDNNNNNNNNNNHNYNNDIITTITTHIIATVHSFDVDVK